MSKHPLFGPEGPLAALATLASTVSVPGAAEPVVPEPLPDLPSYTQRLDHVAASGPDGPRYLRERRAGKSELHDHLMMLLQLESALHAARDGQLDPDWREQGLAKAVAEAADGRKGHDLWAWTKMNKETRDVWEPKVFAHYADAWSTLTSPGQPVWRMPLERWRVDLLTVKSVQEERDPRAVSRWAGFNLVNAWMFNKPAWNAVLDRHEGSWPDTLTSYDGPWPESLRAHQLLTELDRIELSYEIGLASGGVAIDWRDNHIRRVQRWRMAGEREAAVAHLDLLSPDTIRYRLPKTWLAPDAV